MMLGVTYFVGLVLVIWAPLLVSVVSSKYSQPQTVPVLGAELEVSLQTVKGDLFLLTKITSYSKGPPVSPQCSSMDFEDEVSWMSSNESISEATQDLEDACQLKNSIHAMYMRSEGQLWGATP